MREGTCGPSSHEALRAPWAPWAPWPWLIYGVFYFFSLHLSVELLEREAKRNTEAILWIPGKREKEETKRNTSTVSPSVPIISLRPLNSPYSESMSQRENATCRFANVLLRESDPQMLGWFSSKTIQKSTPSRNKARPCTMRPRYDAVCGLFNNSLQPNKWELSLPEFHNGQMLDLYLDLQGFLLY